MSPHVSFARSAIRLRAPPLIAQHDPLALGALAVSAPVSTRELIERIVRIPLHRWRQPVGVVVAMGDRPIDTGRILEHQLAYDVLALALAAALWGGPRAPAIDVAAPPPASLVCEAWLEVRARGLVEA